MRGAKITRAIALSPMHCPLSEIPEFIPNIYTCKLVFRPSSIYTVTMNPHFEKAQTLLTSAKTSYASEFKTANAAQAHAEASLAIAFELKTANILALEARLLKKPSVNENLITEVSERLGYNLDPS